MTETISRPLDSGPQGPVPPQSLDAERSVLAALLLDPEAVGRAIELVDPRDFYRTAHQRVYESILGLFNRSEKIDLVTLTEELRKRGELEAVGGPAMLAQILDYAATSANLEQHIRIVSSKAVLRGLIRAANEIQQECYAASDETGNILDRAEQRIFEITDQRVRTGFVSMKDLMMPTMKHIEELSERKVYVTGVPSGYNDLDQITAGFQNSDLVIIAGRPSMGKTSFALNLAENAAIHHQKNVAVLSLEMSKEQLVLRMLCSQAEVPLFKVRSGHLSDAEFRRLVNLTGGLYKAPIWIDDSPSPTVLEIRAKCRRLRAENKLDLVLIDYLQFIRPGGTAENRVQEISQITRSLKALAKELNVPVIALSQLSRAVETRSATDRRPQLSDLRESGCLTADTRVMRADTGAEVTLGDLLASGERDIPVWTLDDQLSLRRGTMTHVFPSGVKPVFSLTVASGLTVRASDNHPFLTLDGWKPLRELRVGERLAVPRRVAAPESVSEWPDAEVVMLAHLLEDGCFVTRQPVHYTSADPANLEAVEGAATHFGIRPRRVAQESWCHVYLPSPHRLARGRRNPIPAWLDRFGLYGLRSPEKIRARMASRCVTTRALAASLGTAYCGSTVYKHAPSRERLARVSAVLQDPELGQLARSDVFWDTIRSIAPAGEEPVFDATVPGTHNFIANGIVAHNSIEQDADVVLFVFREEMYKRDDPSLRGKAEIIVAKQRNGPTGDINLTFLHEYTKFVPFSPIMPGETEPEF